MDSPRNSTKNYDKITMYTAIITDDGLTLDPDDITQIIKHYDNYEIHTTDEKIYYCNYYYLSETGE